MSGGIWNALLAAAAIAFLAPPTAAQEESPEPTRFLDRETLTGAWGGIRPSLADHGISIDAAYTLDLLWNVRGGIDTGRATRSNLNISFEWDTEKAGAWDGGLFGLEFQSTQGASLTEQFVGDFQSLTNLDAEDFTRVSQFWYRQSLADGRFWVQIGKQDANAEIGAGLAESSVTAAGRCRNAPFSPFFNIQPAVQHIADYGGSDSDDASLFGLETTLQFQPRLLAGKKGRHTI